MTPTIKPAETGGTEAVETAGTSAVTPITYEPGTEAMTTLTNRVIKTLQDKYPRHLTKRGRGWSKAHRVMPNVHVRDLAVFIGVTPGGMSRLLYGEVKTPSITVGLKLAVAMGIEPLLVPVVLGEFARRAAAKQAAALKKAKKEAGTEPRGTKGGEAMKGSKGGKGSGKGGGMKPPKSMPKKGGGKKC